MTTGARLFFATLGAFLLCVGVLFAQQGEPTSVDFEEWERIARIAERAVETQRSTDSTFEALRNTIAQYRAQFDTARNANAERIAVLREQIAALGPPPDGEGAQPEPDDVAATRAELTQQLTTVQAPIQRAEAAFVRADALVGQIDRVMRSRKAERLLTVSPTPLNPAYWGTALTDFNLAARALWQERSLISATRSWTDLRETLPVALALGALGLILIYKGQRWSRRIIHSLQTRGTRGYGIWQFLASLLRILLPFAGVMALAYAVIWSDVLGPRGNDLLLLLAALSGIMLGVRWVADRLFARQEADALIALPGDVRSTIRFHVGIITGMIVLGTLIAEVLDFGLPAAATEAVLIFPVYLISSISLYRIGVPLRGYAEPKTEGDATTEFRASTLSRLVRALGTGAIIVGIIAPLQMAAGYFNAAEAFLPPYIMTLGVFGLVTALQRFAADVYGAVTGQGAAARDALIPVLFGFVLLLASIPALALIWGARLTDLAELWAALGRGFSIGETRISPTDFLAFAVIFVIGYTLTRLVQSALRTNVLPKTKLDVGGQNAMVAGLGYVGIFLAALAAISGAGLDLSSLAFVAGALSVGIGFGLQNIVSNFVSGIILLIERPISEGDWIEVGGQMGYVRDISVRSTRIETFDRTDVIVPNADLVSGTVTNYTRGNTVGRLIVPVGVAYGTDTKCIETILREIVEDQPMVLMNPQPNVFFLNFGADALEFEIRCFLRDVNWIMVVKSDINHAIAARFAKEGIEVPFAQRDIWLRNPESLRHDHAVAGLGCDGQDQTSS